MVQTAINCMRERLPMIPKSQRFGCLFLLGQAQGESLTLSLMHQLDLYFEPWLQRTCFVLLCTACMRSLDALCVLCSLAFCVVVVESVLVFVVCSRPMCL